MSHNDQNPAPIASSVRVCAILTCFNRRSKTISSLRSLELAAAQAGIDIEAIVADDMSHDGTAQEVTQTFPWATVVKTGGNFFWCKGMHLANTIAQQRAADHVLWLNDDVMLHPEALVKMLQTHRGMVASGHDGLVVGATHDGSGQVTTYGGLMSVSRLRRFSYRKVGGTTEPVPCDAMNGNVVLVPAAVSRMVGNLDARFEHAMGDIDYALRARRSGFQVILCPGYIGVCSPNEGRGNRVFHGESMLERLRAVSSRKATPPRSWWTFTRQHGGWMWPVYFAWPYLIAAIGNRKQPAPPSSR